MKTKDDLIREAMDCLDKHVRLCAERQEYLSAKFVVEMQAVLKDALTIKEGKSP